jgi:MFS family permease
MTKDCYEHIAKEKAGYMSEPTQKTTKQSEISKTGMLGFTIIWIGQLFSLLGTTMTGFALALWVYSAVPEGFRATAFSLVAFFSFLPLVLVSPVAGAIVDRHDRKRIMMLADLAAGLPTVAVLLLYISGSLQLWHLFITGAIAASFQAFHFPAYSAAVTMMVRKEHYGRASGMLAAAQFASGIFAPIVAALVLALSNNNLAVVMIIDIITFVSAIFMLFFVHIPRPPRTEAGQRGIGSIWKESFYGFRYIYERPSLLGLQLTFFCVNFFSTFGNVLLTPMVLTRIGDEVVGRNVLATVLSAGGIGGLVGSIILSIWGGPKRRVHGVLLGMVSTSLAGMLLIGLGRDSFVWALAMFLGLLTLPIINGSNQAIWQAKVAPDVQGRVFATRLLIAQISVPAAMLMVGPLTDWIFEPAMSANGMFSNMFGWLVGTGAGAGMSLMFVLTGILGAVIGLGAYAIHAIRDAEDILPDHGVGADVGVNPKPAEA